MGGIVVRDEAWNKTISEFRSLVKNYFDGEIPEGFELHSHDLLSSNGDSYFRQWDREKRNNFTYDILNLCEERMHQFHLFAIDKFKLQKYSNCNFKNRNYNCKIPYLVAYDYLLSLINYHCKNKLGRSARGLIILDIKEQFKQNIRKISQFRRYNCTGEDKVKWIVEISYPIDSRENPMIQISDLVCFISKKYYEIKNGYRPQYSKKAIDFYENAYSKIYDRLIRKTVLKFDLKRNEPYYNFLKAIKA